MTKPDSPDIVEIDDLTPDPANVRRHTDRSRDAVSNSLRAFGPARSVVVDGKNVVRAGNQTLEMAKKAGVKRAIIVDADGESLIVVRRKDWSATEATAYAIADNRTAELSEWDEDCLADVISSLQTDDEMLAAAIGFDNEEIENLINGTAKYLGPTDPANDPKAEWQGMPEFELEDQMADSRLIVHFKSPEDRAAFAKLVGQQLTDRTRFIWFPAVEIEHAADKVYA